MKTMTPENDCELQLRKLTQAISPDGDYGNVILCEAIARIERIRSLIGAGPPETRKSLELELAKVDRTIEIAKGDMETAVEAYQALVADLSMQNRFLLDWSERNLSHTYTVLVTHDCVLFSALLSASSFIISRVVLIELAAQVLW